MNNEKITILCSTVDEASQNIKQNLFHLRDWRKANIEHINWDKLESIYENDSHRIIEINEHHIYQDHIDDKIKSYGFDTNLIIVASKHKSADGRPVLTAHFTGNPNKADFGGKDRELSTAAPCILHSILGNMNKLGLDTEYEVNMESTHHGPSSIKTAMVYAEIGSGSKQWRDPLAGDIVARSILAADQRDLPVAIGFGGGHYASLQTQLVLGTDITFGHNFPEYQLEHVDKEMISQAFEKSLAHFAYLDRKSMPTKTRERISRIIEELNYPIFRESNIHEMKGLPWELFIEIHRRSEKVHANGRFKISDSFREYIKKHDQNGNSEMLKRNITTENISEGLIQKCISCDKDKTIKMLNNLAPVYIEKENGTISNIILGIKDKIEITMQDITNECIKILKEHYELKYIPEDNKLHIIDEQFSPDLALKLGIKPGPMYGKLAMKESIIIDGMNIDPKMVHVQKIITIPLSNAVKITQDGI